VDHDRITANLPSRDFSATADFYQALGFVVEFRDASWMIMTRGPLELEFFPYPDLDPSTSSFGACVRIADVDALHAAWTKAGLPLHGIPRLTPPKEEPWGARMAALVDLDGSLLRCMTFPE
jgi:catechol 2,3-dioxygenase-like lactoylglutathione lyase family enzyme